jgi:hypothetical protein
MWIYDAQQRKLHELTPGSDPTQMLPIFGYRSTHLKVLCCAVHALTGLHLWDAETAKEALEARLHMHRRLSLRGLVHDIRTFTDQPKLYPEVARRHTVAVKYLVHEEQEFKEYCFVVSTRWFDTGEPRDLNF